MQQDADFITADFLYMSVFYLTLYYDARKHKIKIFNVFAVCRNPLRHFGICQITA
jgi:hypothetical protein